MLADVLKRFRSDPVIKQALGRGQQPDTKALYDALMRFKNDEEFMRFMRSRQPNGTRLVYDQPFDPEPRKLYKDSGPVLVTLYEEFARDVQREMSRAVRGKLTADVRKCLVAWVHNNSRSASLPNWAIDEMMHTPGIRPDGAVKLYRGIMFKKWQMDDPKWSGEDHPRSAKIFLNALLHGHLSFRLDYKFETSWTTNESIAENFARKNAATSEFGAMMNWIRNSDRFIDGELGVVLSATVPPSQIIVDVSKIDLGHLLHGNEGEMIVAGGPLLIRIEHIYTPKGEINVGQFADFMNTRHVHAK